MNEYIVHVYAEIRVPIRITADTPDDAVKQAANLDIDHIGRDNLSGTPEYTGDTSGYVVDARNPDGDIVSWYYEDEEATYPVPHQNEVTIEPSR